MLRILKKIYHCIYQFLRYIFLGLIAPYILIRNYIEDKVVDVKIYKYTALDCNNSMEIGYVKAENKELIKKILVAENKKLLRAKTNNIIKFRNRHIFDKEISKKNLVFFLVQITEYMKAGNNLISALSFIIKKVHNKQFACLLKQVRYELMCGHSLAEALEKQEKAFPKLLIEVLKKNNTNDFNHLIEMRDYYKQLYLNDKENNKFNFYRIIVIPFILFVLTIIMGYVMPQFYNLYSILFHKKILILKSFLKYNQYINIIYIFLITFLVIIMTFYFLYSNKKIKNYLQYKAMNMKILKKFIINNQMFIYTKTLLFIIKYQIYDVEALNNLTNNDNFQKLIINSVNSLRYGHAIAHVLKDDKYCPIKAYEMILVGEKIDSVLLQVNNLASYYQKSVKETKDKVMMIISPILVIFSAILFGSLFLIIIFQCLIILK